MIFSNAVNGVRSVTTAVESVCKSYILKLDAYDFSLVLQAKPVLKATNELRA
jgi:hypothetical protein